MPVKMAKTERRGMQGPLDLLVPKAKWVYQEHQGSQDPKGQLVSRAQQEDRGKRETEA